MLLGAPAASEANGTSVIVCPGGEFHPHSINREGVDDARWLNKRGITAFVLKYRLLPTGEDGVRDLLPEASTPEQLDKDIATIFPMAVADGEGSPMSSARSIGCQTP